MARGNTRAGESGLSFEFVYCSPSANLRTVGSVGVHLPRCRHSIGQLCEGGCVLICVHVPVDCLILIFFVFRLFQS